VASLKDWQDVFGERYRAAFVFAYWLYDFPEHWTPSLFDKTDPYRYQQRQYTFVLATVDDYRVYMRPRSVSWDTVFVPAGGFKQIACRFSDFLGGPEVR